MRILLSALRVSPREAGHRDGMWQADSYCRVKSYHAQKPTFPSHRHSLRGPVQVLRGAFVTTKQSPAMEHEIASPGRARNDGNRLNRGIISEYSPTHYIYTHTHHPQHTLPHGVSIHRGLCARTGCGTPPDLRLDRETCVSRRICPFCHPVH